MCKSAKWGWKGRTFSFAFGGSLAKLGATKTILSFGETLWDLFPSGPQLGGAPCNLAYRLTALGDHGRLVTRLGRDERGEKAFEQLQILGLATDLIQWDEDHPTGTVQVEVDAQGNPEFQIQPHTAYDFIQITPTLLQAGAAADAICFGTLAQRSPASREALWALLAASPRGWKVLDLNLRKDSYTREIIQDSLEAADVLKMNLYEAHYLAELYDLSASALPEFGAEIMDLWHLKYCVVTLGERGAFAASSRGERIYVPGYKVTVADSCGSGDAFTAGFLKGLLHHRSLAESCRLGNAMGTLVATQPGGTGLVTPDDMQQFLQGAHERWTEPHLRPFSVL